MIKILYAILILLILINIISFIYVRIHFRKLNKNNKGTEEDYEKIKKYLIFSVILSFVTILFITTVAIIKLLK